MKRRRLFAVAIVSTVLLSACAGPGRLFGGGPKKAPDGNGLLVAAALYPVAEMVDAVGRSRVKVLNLTPPGTDAHGVELSAQQLELLQEAKITFYLGENYQPTVQKSIESLRAKTVNLLDSLDLQTMVAGAHADEEHGDEHANEEPASTTEKDPHVWLDPANMIDMTRVIANTLTQLAPQFADEFASNAATYIDSLEVLGKELDTRFATCASRTLITAHYSFGYFASRAKLDVYSVADINPDEQLSAKKLEELAGIVKDKKVSTIFYEELVSQDLARTLADKAGVTTDTLNPLEGLSQKDLDDGKTYVSVQRDNISKIAAALSCS